MLADSLHKLAKYSLTLASSSPRRQTIFRDMLHLNYQVTVPKFQENIEKSSCNGPEDYVAKTCQTKNAEIVNELRSSSRSDELPYLVVSADTIVVLNNEILEKPKDYADAITMLSKLSGNTHQVLTAVSISVENIGSKTFIEKTNVTFCHLSREIVEKYVESGEPMDKAGGYGIQGVAGSFISGINGCYYNVVGFPVNRFCIELIDLLATE